MVRPTILHKTVASRLADQYAQWRADGLVNMVPARAIRRLPFLHKSSIVFPTVQAVLLGGEEGLDGPRAVVDHF